MKAFISLMCILFGLAIVGTGLYLGVWVMLVGGIVDFINAVKMTPVEAMPIALAIVKIIFFEIPIALGFIVGYIFCRAASD